MSVHWQEGFRYTGNYESDTSKADRCIEPIDLSAQKYLYYF